MLLKLAPQAKRIAIIHENDKFSTDVATALKKYAEEQRMQAPLFEGYDCGHHGLRPLYQQDSPAGWVPSWAGGHFADTTTFARQLYEKKVPITA